MSAPITWTSATAQSHLHAVKLYAKSHRRRASIFDAVTGSVVTQLEDMSETIGGGGERAQRCVVLLPSSFPQPVVVRMPCSSLPGCICGLPGLALFYEIGSPAFPSLTTLCQHFTLSACLQAAACPEGTATTTGLAHLLMAILSPPPPQVLPRLCGVLASGGLDADVGRPAVGCAGSARRAPLRLLHRLRHRLLPPRRCAALSH